MKLIGIAGWSGAGKTTLLIKLVPLLIARGLSVSTVKHAHHAFEIDVPGKDSHQHRQAGAQEVLISSGRRFALVHELRGADEWQLPRLLSRLSPVDLVLVEGFKGEIHPKIEVFRASNAKPPLFPENATVRAIAADVHFVEAPIPQIPLDDIEAIASACLTFSSPMAEVFPEVASWRN